MNLDCLSTRVMKAKYYPNNDFLNASLGSHPSYAWRSIWNARGLLEAGMGWWVGNDKSTNIWNEAWLLRPSQGIITGQNINVNFTTVANLINFEQTTWSLKALRKLFDEEKTNRIQTIPIARVNIKEVRVWRGDNTGVYSAKSGHKWLLKENTRQMQWDVMLQISNLQNFYIRLWSLQIASKIKITM